MASRRLQIAPSSAVAQMDYDDVTRELSIEWASGRVDVYRGVPAMVALDAEKAPSVGQFVNRVIRPQYSTH